MKIFVTGANGFIGRHLSTHLVEAGHEVTAGVRAHSAAPAGTNKAVIGNIGPDTSWANLLVGHDVVIHLAARVHVMQDRSKDPIAEFRRVNTAGTRVLAGASARQGVPRFVFLSSIKVNGRGTTYGRPYTASDEPHPDDPYSISKHEAELALREVGRETGMGVVIVRTPLVYGPHVGGNFRTLLALARQRVPLPLASVDNRRTLASVWNLASLLEKSASQMAADGTLIFAGDAASPSTPELIQELSSAMGSESRLFHFPIGLLQLAGNFSGRSAEIRRLTSSLEVEAGSSSGDWRWYPPFGFAESIQRTVNWYLESIAQSGARDSI